MNKIKLAGKTLVLAFAAVSATAVMANDTQMRCVNDQGHELSRTTVKAECDKLNGTMMTEKDMVIKQDRMKEDKMKHDDQMKQEQLAKADKAKEDKMK
jgi:hypothetical protein